MKSPYHGLPPARFWKTGVEKQSPFSVQSLYKKKFDLTGKTIATAGSCFAQHIAIHMRACGYSVLDVEPPPRQMSVELARKYGYLLYSARYGNVYLVRQLLQLTQEAFGEFSPVCAVWKKGDRFFDALRPSVEPDGFPTEKEVRAHREQHLAAVRKILKSANVLVFTMGLTEGWVHKQSGTVFPTAPGTIAGEYDPDLFEFRNFGFREIFSDFEALLELLRRVNPTIKLILTVSPVPLTATATEDHVLVATTYSKSTLRSVAGELAEKYEFIDYFPSYELIATHFSRGMFYSSNLRSVEQAGVESVMKIFFLEHGLGAEATPQASNANLDPDDVVCEEAILDAFAKI